MILSLDGTELTKNVSPLVGRSHIARIAMLAVVALFVILGGTRVASASSQISEPSNSIQQAETSTKSKKDEKKSDKTDNKNKKDNSKAPSAFTEKCKDENGSLTNYALSELTGAELVQSVESLGYTYDTKDGAYVNDKGNKFNAVDTNLKPLDAKALKKLEKGGGDAKIAYLRIASGYKDVRDAFTGLNKCSTDDVMVRNDKYVYAVVHGPSMKEYLVLVAPKDDTYVLAMYSNEAVAAGLVGKISKLDDENTEKLGNSIDEVWKALTDGPVGDYVREHPFK